MLIRPSGQPWPCSTVARPAFWCDASSLPPSNDWCLATIRILRPLRFVLGKKKRVWKLCSNQRAKRVPKWQLRAKDTGCLLTSLPTSPLWDKVRKMIKIGSNVVLGNFVPSFRPACIWKEGGDCTTTLRGLGVGTNVNLRFVISFFRKIAHFTLSYDAPHKFLQQLSRYRLKFYYPETFVKHS